MTHAETSTIAPTHKEILSDPKLFNTYITDLDHDLNYTPTSNTPNPLPQLAHPPLTEVHENSIRTTKSTVPSNSIADVLTPTHPNIPCPTHTSDSPKAPETTTFPSYHNVTNKTELVHGTWRRIGPPHDNMNASISSEIVLGPKRKQQEAPSPDDSHNDKK